MSQLDISEELARARSGDRAALNRLLSNIQDRLQRLTQARLGPSLRAKVRPSDLLQSALLEVVRDIENFRGETEESFFAWIGRILENNVRRKGRFFRAEKRRSDAHSSEVRREAETATTLRTPSREIERIEELLMVGDVLEALPEEYREVIILRTVENKNHKEIADAIGKSEGATRMILSRARAALARALEKSEKD